MAHDQHDPTKGVPIERMYEPSTVSQCSFTTSSDTGEDRHLVARCLAPRCGVVEAFDLKEIPCVLRRLTLDALSPKLRRRCGSRQVRLGTLRVRRVGA